MSTPPPPNQDVVLFHPGLGHPLHSSGWSETLTVLRSHVSSGKGELLITHYSPLDAERDLPVIDGFFDGQTFDVSTEGNSHMELRETENQGEGGTFANCYTTVVRAKGKLT